MIDWRIERFEEIQSTQDLALERARKGAAEGLVIMAKRQSRGRGRSGNQWQSIPGNLLFSFVLRPRTEIANLGHYSFLCAVALNRTLSGYLSPGKTVGNKWPNDLLIGGKKIAGILLEIEPEMNGGDGALVIGMGVNIVSAPEDRTFLRGEVGGEVEASEVLSSFLAHMSAVLDQYVREGFGPLREEWLENALNIGRDIRVRLPEAVLDGVFEGLSADGALQLRLAGGELKMIHSGEVFFG